MRLVSILLHGFNLTLLRLAWLIVPGPARRDWWQEWHAELWHVRQACTSPHAFSWPSERQIAAFCLGAFSDAASLDRQRPPVRVPVSNGSARRCILLLAALVATSFAADRLLQGPPMVSPSTPIPHGLVLIHAAASPGDSAPSIPAALFRRWSAKHERLFDQFAFYRIDKEPVISGSLPTARWPVARASLNLFQLLGISVALPLPEAEAPGLPRVFLSDAIWRSKFHQDRQIAGRILWIGKTQAVIAGVVARQSWKLPGQPSLWLLQPASTLPASAPGFVLAHRNPSSDYGDLGPRWGMSATNLSGKQADYTCISLQRIVDPPTGIFWFTFFLACLALPATTSLPLGEYPLTSHPLSWTTRLRRWSFLLAKLALLLPLTYFLSLDLAHLRVSFDLITSEYIQLIASFSICLFGLRWMLRDQRRRCPVCLGKLTHPARVGEPSRNFLGWNGIELVCTGGHGLLHVPETQTSWFSTQRWLYLDASWAVLFTEPGQPSVGYI